MTAAERCAIAIEMWAFAWDGMTEAALASWRIGDALRKASAKNMRFCYGGWLLVRPENAQA